MIEKGILKKLRVPPDMTVDLKDYETDWTFTKELKDLDEQVVKQAALDLLEKNRQELAKAQDLLYASDTFAVLAIFQAMDAAGKDGAIKHVMSGVNPQGCQVTSFKVPSAEELDHDFLWRCVKALPERGRIGIFNRSYYEEVLVVKVHKNLLESQKLPPGKRGKGFWEDRYEDINAFERHLVRNGTVIMKFFLYTSKKEQKKRFLERIDRPEKNWKFSVGDVEERQYWDDYMKAYTEMLSATSTKWAPWYVIPGDQKWAARTLVAEIMTSTIQSLNLKYPTLTDEQIKELEDARQKLLAE